MNIIQKAVKDLKPAEYNPRKMTAKERAEIRESIKRFGFAVPIVVNTHVDRLNVIVGGHQRVIVAGEDLGFTHVPAVEVSLPLEKEMELNLRLNKNTGSWDDNLLGKINKELLTEVGFDKDELEKLVEVAVEKSEVEFAKELLLSHNYVILYFDNDLDWAVAQEKFGLTKVKDQLVRKGQPVGIGRVLNGKEWLPKITK